MTLPKIEDLIKTADDLYTAIDQLHAGNDFASASPFLQRARANVSTALGQLNSHKSAADAKAVVDAAKAKAAAPAAAA